MIIYLLFLFWMYLFLWMPTDGTSLNSTRTRLVAISPTPYVCYVTSLWWIFWRLICILIGGFHLWFDPFVIQLIMINYSK